MLKVAAAFFARKGHYDGGRATPLTGGNIEGGRGKKKPTHNNDNKNNNKTTAEETENVGSRTKALR